MPEGKKRIDVVPPLVHVGLSIQRARKKRRMTVEKLAKITRVSSRYINEIESGNFSSLPGKAYVLGFTRAVTKALGLDDAEIVAVVKSELYSSERIDSDMHPPCGVSPRSVGKALLRLLRLSRTREREPEVMTFAS